MLEEFAQQARLLDLSRTGRPESRPTRDIDLPARMDMTRRVTRIFASENIKDVGCKMGAKWVQYWPFEPSTTTM